MTQYLMGAKRRWAICNDYLEFEFNHNTFIFAIPNLKYAFYVGSDNIYHKDCS